jgi:hypothetical protein
MRIETQTEFEAWLESNFWLHDVLINALEPHPKTISENSGEPPSQVKLVGIAGDRNIRTLRFSRNVARRDEKFCLS